MSAYSAPQVSVIVPVYNAMPYLVMCLDSLCAQTLADIEFVCVNDGSSDSSLEVLNSYKEKDPRFVVVSQPNRGYGAAMNQGLDHAGGKYIGLVEPDDYVEPNMFENLLERVEAYRCDYVKSQRYDVRGGSDSRIEVFPTLFLSHSFAPLREITYFSTAPSTWTGLYRRDFLENNAIRWNETPGASYQDTGFAFKVGVAAQACVIDPGAYYHYRRDNDNASSASTKKVWEITEEYRLIEEWLDGYLDLHQADKVAARQAFALMKINGYFWTYFRIAFDYRYAFLRTMSEEFRLLKEKGFVDKALFPLPRQVAIDRIINDPEGFFDCERRQSPYETEKKKRFALEEENGRLKEEKDRLKAKNARLSAKVSSLEKKISSIRNSYAFRIGNALVKPLRPFRRKK